MKKQRVTVHALTERAWDLRGLSAQEKLVLLHLIRISKKGECAVGIPELANEFEIGERHMITIVGRLVDRELVERQVRFSARGERLRNIYRIVAVVIMGIALSPVVTEASNPQPTSEDASYATLPKRRRRTRAAA